MVDQLGRLQEILADIESPDDPIPIVFVDWAPDTAGEAATPLRDVVDLPIVSSPGAMIGLGGFFETICSDMVAAAFALNPLDAETRHIGSYPMQVYQDDGELLVVDMEDELEYARVQAFLEQAFDEAR
ncbi:MAG: hypothetical protein B7733_00515 [Myxococcales bacterium FL481]|nr:MAG: hypothetical protein B7733_00515 [Myxococcales bacterium FL481]